MATTAMAGTIHVSGMEGHENANLSKKEEPYVKEIGFLHCYVAEPGGANYRQPENHALLEQRSLRRVSTH